MMKIIISFIVLSNITAFSLYLESISISRGRIGILKAFLNSTLTILLVIYIQSVNYKFLMLISEHIAIKVAKASCLLFIPILYMFLMVIINSIRNLASGKTEDRFVSRLKALGFTFGLRTMPRLLKVGEYGNVDTKNAIVKMIESEDYGFYETGDYKDIRDFISLQLWLSRDGHLVVCYKTPMINNGNVEIDEDVEFIYIPQDIMNSVSKLNGFLEYVLDKYGLKFERHPEGNLLLKNYNYNNAIEDILFFNQLKEIYFKIE